MKSLFSVRRTRRRLNAGLSSLVILSLTFAPLSAEATQSGSQASASSTNKLASTLSTAVSVLTLAQGALSISKGVEQFSCCTKGCTGAGTDATAKKAGQDAAATAGGAAVQKTYENSKVTAPTNNRVDPEFNQRFPDSACRGPGLLRQFPLLEAFLAPRTAQASGCTDALLAIATGGIMLLSGMMGMMSALQAQSNADTAAGNEGGLGSLDGSGASGMSGASGPGQANAGSTMAGKNGAAANGIRIDPALLRDGTAGQVMSRFEKQFGIDRDQFAQDIADGKDPRDLLASAPQNALSRADLAKAENAANNMSDAEKANALNSADLAAIQKEMLANASFGQEDTAYDLNGSSRKPAAKSFSSEELAELDLGSSGAGDLASAELSPEIQAALAEREANQAMKSHVDTTLFEVVHRKYMEKVKMISGAGIPGGLNAGR